MPFPKDLISVTFGGTLAQDNEIWSCGFHIDPFTAAGGATGVLALIGASIDDLGALLEDYVANPAVLVPTGVEIGWLKVAAIGTDGKYLEEAVETPLTGTGSVTGPYIPQAALVNTLVSTKWKDPGRYNRFYLPVSIANFGPGFYGLNQEAQETYVAALAELIEDVNTFLGGLASGSAGVVCVASATGEGWNLAVEEVRVGRVIDTQRRRRNNLPEAYVSAEVTPF